jgi:hypothetical protein
VTVRARWSGIGVPDSEEAGNVPTRNHHIAAAPLIKSEAEAGAFITSVITGSQLSIRRIMSIIDKIKDAIPIQLVVYSILAIPIGWHIYVTYKEQRRRIEKRPPWRKD